jgi:hypothetical protein
MHPLSSSSSSGRISSIQTMNGHRARWHSSIAYVWKGLAMQDNNLSSSSDSMRLHRRRQQRRRISETNCTHARRFETACSAVRPGVAKDRKNGHTSSNRSLRPWRIGLGEAGNDRGSGRPVGSSRPPHSRDGRHHGVTERFPPPSPRDRTRTPYAVGYRPSIEKYRIRFDD